MNTLHSNRYAGRRLANTLILLSLFGSALPANAQTTVEEAWIRATVPGQPSTGAFMKIIASSDSKLVSVQSSIAKTVQIHRSTMQNDVMRMEPVASVLLPAGKTVVFDPESYHVMLIDLSIQVRVGDKVPLTLVVEDAAGKRELVTVDAEAKALNTSDSGNMN